MLRKGQNKKFVMVSTTNLLLSFTSSFVSSVIDLSKGRNSHLNYFCF